MFFSLKMVPFIFPSNDFSKSRVDCHPFRPLGIQQFEPLGIPPWGFSARKKLTFDNGTMEHPPSMKKRCKLCPHLKMVDFPFPVILVWLWGCILPLQSLTKCLQRGGWSPGRYQQQVLGRELMVMEEHTRCILVKQFYSFRFIESNCCFWFLHQVFLVVDVLLGWNATSPSSG